MTVHENRTVVMVTGAQSGIGAAVTAAFRSAGQCVAACDLDPEIVGLPHGYHVDVTDSVAVDNAVEVIESELGKIVTLVNCAGILRPGSLLDMTDADWEKTQAVNATGVFYVTRAVGSRMAQRKAGAIVTVASNAALVPRMDLGAYAASKAAAAHLTRCFGLELAAHGIRCNVVAPGSTDTPMLQDLLAGKGATSLIEGNLSQHRLGIPLRRIATPDDIADAVVYLASEQARHITMQELTVDGGASLR
ncbi:SDR family oxidoreductase [Natronoglycomyces albus]|uniref:SDR family oxidoreductase n=1 Tax=Natronoglycomyces albus TaxID=2811108 RepID=A0A895XDV2_9ACTN|nr:SDR family oxidoreductase [Natronoglycomyces albus]QSB03981.1 SDR family oxidoreductase [Natronoglycomyces albus]